MSDDVEEQLGRLTPRGVRLELRSQVLGAVLAHLQTATRGTEEVVGKAESVCGVSLRQPPPSPWLRRAAAAVAASLLVGIGLNVWVNKESARRLAELFGPPPISKGAMEIAEDVQTMTDARTGQWVYGRLAVPTSPAVFAAARAEYCEQVKMLIDELQTVSKDFDHETLQKSFEMDRHRAGGNRGDSTDCQRRLRLDYRCTA